MTHSPEYTPALENEQRVNPLIKFVEIFEKAAVQEPKKRYGVNKGGIIGVEFDYQTPEEKELARTNILAEYPQAKILTDSETALGVHCMLNGLKQGDSEEMGKKYNAWMEW